MDLSFVNSHLANDVSQPPWATGLGSATAGTDESFADHLQAEPQPSSAATSASATHAAPPIETTSADAPPHKEADDPHAVDDPVDPEDDAAAAAIPAEPSTPQVVESDTTPPARRDADKPACAPDKSQQPPARSAGTDATAGVKTAGTSDADPTTPDPTGRTPVPQNPVQEHPVPQHPVAVPFSQETTPTPAQPQQPSADLAVVSEAAADPTLTAENATAASATTATAEKSSGKLKTEKSSATARAIGAQKRDAAASSELAVTLSTAAAVEVGARLAHRLAGTASSEQTSPEQGLDQASTTSAPDGDARTQARERTQTLTERLPEQLFVRGSASPSSAHELTQADQQRLIQRVARAMEAASQRGGPLRLRLRPPELGSLRLEVSLQDGNLSARIETETQATKTLLLDQLPQLRDRLAERGFHVAQLDVDVSQQHSGDTSFAPPDAENALPAAPARHHAIESTESPAELTPNQLVYAQPGKLNVVI